MKIAILAALALTLTAPVFGKSSHSVRGYTKKDGTYVAPHRATDRDNSKSNNWSQKGNTNPYTGKKGLSKMRRTFAAWLLALFAASTAGAANRRGSHRMGGRSSKGKGARYVGGRSK
jgi:hypothetical protein